jgi:hypothetical protein
MIYFCFLTGLCILLRRLSYPNRWIDVQKLFGRDIRDLSNIFNTMLNFIYYKYRHLVISLNQWWLNEEYLQSYSNAVERKGSVINNCFGFIDGMV